MLLAPHIMHFCPTLFSLQHPAPLVAQSETWPRVALTRARITGPALPRPRVPSWPSAPISPSLRARGCVHSSRTTAYPVPLIKRNKDCTTREKALRDRFGGRVPESSPTRSVGGVSAMLMGRPVTSMTTSLRAVEKVHPTYLRARRSTCQCFVSLLYARPVRVEDNAKTSSAGSSHIACGPRLAV